MTTGAEPGLDERLWQVWLQAARGRGVLPAEPMLAQTLDTSRPAVREALVRLEERGYIHRRRGTDTVVNGAALGIPARFDARMDKAELIAAMGHAPGVRVCAHRVDTVTIAEATEFGLVPATRVLRLTKVWTADGVPAMLARDSVPLTAAAAPDESDFDRSVFELAPLLAGEPVEWEIVWPDAENLSEADAESLGRPVGEAALSVAVSGVGRSGQVVYWAEELHVRQVFRYAMVRGSRR